MYRDKCIEAFSEYHVSYRWVIDKIKSAQSFHIGEIDNFLAPRARIDDVFLPYKTCWVSFSASKTGSVPSEYNAKFGAALIWADEDGDGVHVITFWRFDNPKHGFGGHPYRIHVGQFETNLLDFNGKPFYDDADGIPVERKEKDIQREMSRISCFFYLFDLLSCKNIVKIRHDPPAKLNKKRTRSGKEPLYTYHTLDVILPGRRHIAAEPGDPTGRTVRLHLCRGHFKEYTPERPLFGKYTGRYWWQPIARGDKRAGVVMKNYNVKVEGGMA